MVSNEEQGLLSEPQDNDSTEHGNPDLGTFPPSTESILSTSSDNYLPSSSPAPPRLLTFTNGIAIVVGLQVGSGIFSSPSAIATNVGSPALAMLVWLLAGFLAWTGAATFIELGSTVPRNGGVQEYLRHYYGDTYGFLAAWNWVFVVKPCSVATLSLTFAEYLVRGFASHDLPSIWVLRGTALLAATVITYINCIGTHVGANTANFFFFLKLIGLCSIVIIGMSIFIFPLDRHPHAAEYAVEISNIPGIDDASLAPGLWNHLGGYTDATLAALWAYSGWEALGLVAGELQNPKRNVPRVLNSAMVIVITLFLLANAAYFTVIPMDIMVKTNTVALDFGRTVFGPVGALFYAWVVCLSCFGGLNAKIFTAGRMTEAAVERHYLPDFLSTASKSPKSLGPSEDGRKSPSAFSIWRQRLLLTRKSPGIPINAMLFNLFLTAIYLFLGTFRSLIVFVGMSESVALFAAVASVLIFRRRANASNPATTYRTYAINPVIYCTVIIVVIVRSAISHPLQGVVIVIFYGVGVGLYKFRWWHRTAGRAGDLG